MATVNLSGEIVNATSEEAAYAKLNGRLDAIIADGQQTEGNTELIDIRTGADNTVYQTAGTAVRSQVQGLSDDIQDINDEIGQYVYTLTATSSANVAIRYDIEEDYFTSGATVYVKYLSMTGGTAQSLRLYGQIDSENFDRLLTNQQVGVGATVKLERDYIALRLYTGVEDGQDGVNATAVMLCDNAPDMTGTLCEIFRVSDLAESLNSTTAKKVEIANMTNVTTCRIYRRVCCCGDSYTAGYIHPIGEQTASRVNEDYAWAHYLSLMTGNEYINCGVSGSNANTWLTASRGLQKAQEAGKCQAYLVGLGINDSSDDESRNLYLGSVSDIGTNAVTYYGKMSKIVTELYNINNDADIFLMTCPDGKNGTYNPERYDGYNQAVRDIVSYFSDKAPKVYCLDLAAKKEMFIYNSSLTMDRANSHYTAAGYEQFAEIIYKLWSEYINSNIQYFAKVYQIPYDSDDNSTYEYKIIRGDTWIEPVQIFNEDGTAHAYNPNEVVKFALSTTQDSSGIVIQKTLEYDFVNNIYSLVLSSAETASLQAGTYYFDIGIQVGTEYVHIIDITKLQVSEGISGG